LVAAAQAVIGEGRGLAVQVGATVVAAAAFQPLRTRVQWAVDTIFYGERSRPYEVLTRLGLLLEQTPAPETVLPSVVETVAVALRVPHVAVQLREGDGWVIAAAHGEPVGEPESFPMVYSDEVVGRLLVGRRGADDGFTHADRRLLGDLARHTGVAAHAVQLTEALRRSRTALVNAREEERRRLRRDLHDGLGPALAGVTLGLHAAAAHVPRDPRRAVALIEELERQIEEAVADIRRLVYNLRPPALDELGLAQAVRREAARLEGDGVELSIVVDVPTGGVGTLPAAVEVAAFRIVAEALTNVTRHARAHHCEVRIRRSGDGPLEVEIVDDGVGLNGRPAGVGLAAMRERAEELGGACRVSSDGGTRVLARLPIMEVS
jgi:signal transduction histidine kinase